MGSCRPLRANAYYTGAILSEINSPLTIIVLDYFHRLAGVGKPQRHCRLIIKCRSVRKYRHALPFATRAFRQCPERVVLSRIIDLAMINARRKNWAIRCGLPAFIGDNLLDTAILERYFQQGNRTLRSEPYPAKTRKIVRITWAQPKSDRVRLAGFHEGSKVIEISEGAARAAICWA